MRKTNIIPNTTAKRKLCVILQNTMGPAQEGSHQQNTLPLAVWRLGCDSNSCVFDICKKRQAYFQKIIPEQIFISSSCRIVLVILIYSLSRCLRTTGLTSHDIVLFHNRQWTQCDTLHNIILSVYQEWFSVILWMGIKGDRPIHASQTLAERVILLRSLHSIMPQPIQDAEV